jgi:hypothetical protein
MWDILHEICAKKEPSTVFFNDGFRELTVFIPDLRIGQDSAEFAQDAFAEKQDYAILFDELKGARGGSIWAGQGLQKNIAVQDHIGGAGCS